MDLHLDAVERRVLGSLMEKESTTPDYYPLTVNALLAACNQKSNREPVMELEESVVRAALRSLEEKQLAATARSDGRVPRYEHRLGEVWNLGRRESAVLCTLLLRGAQTPGELRGRSERLQRIEDLDEMQLVLQKLTTHDPPLALLLPRLPGTKESRYADLLGGEEDVPNPVEASAATQPSSPPGEGRAGGDASASAQRIAALEAEVSHLRGELETLRQQFETFRSQFEN